MQNITAFVIPIPERTKKKAFIETAMECVQRHSELAHVRVFPLLDDFDSENKHKKNLAGTSLLAYITTTSGVISSEDCEKLKKACSFDINCTALRDVQITTEYWNHIVEHNTFPERVMLLQAANIPKGKKFTDLVFCHVAVKPDFVDTAKAGLKNTFGLDETPFWQLTGEGPFTISYVKPEPDLPRIADVSMCADLALVKSKMSEATSLVPYANLQYVQEIKGVKTLRDALKSFIGDAGAGASTSGSETQLVGGAGAASGDDMVYGAGNPDVEDVPVKFMDKVLDIVKKRQLHRIQHSTTLVTIILPCETLTTQKWPKDLLLHEYANREIMVLLPLQIAEYGWFMVGVCIENKRLYKMVCNTLPWDSEVDVVELFDAADALAAFVDKHLKEKVLTFPSYNDFSRAAFQCYKKNSRGYAIISMLMAILGLTPEKTETPNLPYANTFCENDVQELSTLVEAFKAIRNEKAKAGALRLLKVAPAPKPPSRARDSTKADAKAGANASVGQRKRTRDNSEELAASVSAAFIDPKLYYPVKLCDAGGNGNCFFYSLYEAAKNTGVLEKITTTFPAVDASSKQLFNETFRTALATYITTHVFEQQYLALKGLYLQNGWGARIGRMFPEWYSVFKEGLGDKETFKTQIAQGVSRTGNYVAEIEVNAARDMLDTSDIWIQSFSKIPKTMNLRRVFNGKSLLNLFNQGEMHWQYFAFIRGGVGTEKGDDGSAGHGRNLRGPEIIVLDDDSSASTSDKRLRVHEGGRVQTFRMRRYAPLF